MKLQKLSKQRLGSRIQHAACQLDLTVPDTSSDRLGTSPRLSVPSSTGPTLSTAASYGVRIFIKCHHLGFCIHQHLSFWEAQVLEFRQLLFCHQAALRYTDVTAARPKPSPRTYLRGEEGPAVGRRAAAAGAVAVVRHRPLQAPLGTARCRYSSNLQTTTETCLHSLHGRGGERQHVDAIIWLLRGR